MCREIFKKIAERQIEGLMFHSDMADYYGFLNLKVFRNFHNNQYLKESNDLRKIKDYFIDHQHQTLLLGSFQHRPNITPLEWEDKTSNDVDGKSLKILLKQSLEKYYIWEDETYMIYKEAAEELFQKGYYDSYCFVRDLMDEVQKEKDHICNLKIDLNSVDYDMTKIKGLQYRMR